MPLNKVIIVGAGPSGLLLSLLLSRAGIQTIVLEQSEEPVHENRAVFYQPVSQFEFERAGINEIVRFEAFFTDSVAWRDPENGESMLIMKNNGTMFALNVGRLAGIVEQALETDPSCKSSQVLRGKKVLSVGQDERNAWVETEDVNGSGKEKFVADYVVGCDGAGSIVRKSILGDGALVGFTHDIQLVAADVRYDLYQDSRTRDSNLFVHPENAWLAFRPSKADSKMWRMIYTDVAGLKEQEYVDRCASQLQNLIPAHPKPEELDIVRVRPYNIHQRIVSKMRVGRVLLASDAAHLCCPYGALGLNGGIADIGSLFDCLNAIHQGKVDDSILDIYSDVRIQKWKTIIDPQSQMMMKLVFSPAQEIYDKPIYKFSKLAEKDPEIAASRAPDPLALRYDFSQHFKIPVQ